MVPLASPAGPRAFSDIWCDRVFASQRNTLCLASDRGVVTTYTGTVHSNGDAAPVQVPLHRHTQPGAPVRRRRPSPRRRASCPATAMPTTGFSTRTVVTSLAGHWSRDLETATLVHGGQRISPPDRNYWGVTFAPTTTPSSSRWPSAAPRTWPRGSCPRARSRPFAPMPSAPHCPRTARAGRLQEARRPRPGRLADRCPRPRHRQETMLAESQSVDDQVEWLDNDTLIYGLPLAGQRRRPVERLEGARRRHRDARRSSSTTPGLPPSSAEEAPDDAPGAVGACGRGMPSGRLTARRTALAGFTPNAAPRWVALRQHVRPILERSPRASAQRPHDLPLPLLPGARRRSRDVLGRDRAGRRGRSRWRSPAGAPGQPACGAASSTGSRAPACPGRVGRLPLPARPAGVEAFGIAALKRGTGGLAASARSRLGRGRIRA